MGILPRPVAVPSGSGKKLKHLSVLHKLTSAETGGAYYLCEAVFGPQGGSPLHIHHFEDEVIYVLDGSMVVRLDTENLEVSSGGVIHLPRKIPHAFQNPLEKPLRIMVYAVPGGLENYFDEVDAALENGSFNLDVHTMISKKYGLEWLE
jgi:mannose-6-phosphate isomerase-like protein (cupin superfamily)